MSCAWKMRFGAVATWAVLVSFALLGTAWWLVRKLAETVVIGGFGLVLLAALAALVITAVFGGAVAGFAIGTILRHALGLPVVP